MRRLSCVVVFVGCSVALTVGGAASRSRGVGACSTDQLAFAFPPTSAPSQTQAIGFAAYNRGRTSCRLNLPLSLTLTHRSGGHLRVAPPHSRLTLVARALHPQGSARVTWTYENYCGRHNSSERPIVYSVHVAGIELRGRGGTPPCHEPRQPISVRVLFACPGGNGPAIAAVLPRPLALCPR